MGPMLRWFVFTIAFGLGPFAMSVLVQWLSGGRPPTVPYSPALLFFSVMICAVQLSGILGTLASGERLQPRKRDVLAGFFAVFLLGAVFSAVLYGTYVSHEFLDPGLRWDTTCARPGAKLDGCAEWITFRVNLFKLSVGVSAFFATIGTIAEWKRSAP